MVWGEEVQQVEEETKNTLYKQLTEWEKLEESQMLLQETERELILKLQQNWKGSTRIRKNLQAVTVAQAMITARMTTECYSRTVSWHKIAEEINHRGH